MVLLLFGTSFQRDAVELFLLNSDAAAVPLSDDASHTILTYVGQEESWDRAI